MTWQAGSLPDPNATYYRVCLRGDPKCWEAPLEYERVVPEGAQDQGWMKLQTSGWSSGEFLIWFEQRIYYSSGGVGGEGGERISNMVLFRIP